MLYTTDDRGILNNYAVEPTIYLAEYPTPEQQKRYAFGGALGALLVFAILFITFSVS
ncbi:MAG: ssl1498 family light-harvesting-like protein [Scytonema sp. RU_4_4]|nr:ssl1498 family light-harvesting-like protein [Scytonema sp. RU_4_4]NJR76300.1 ssl1498 family light-harvesting-like protein [Scytonema sp. CRU_2_7]